MDVVLLAGRLLLAATFLITPYGVVKSAPRVIGAPAVKSSALMRPFSEDVRVLMIRASCVASMLGAVLIALGLWPDLGALLVLAFLVPATLVMHRFWTMDPEDWLKRKQTRDAFLSNMAMAGGALILFWAVNQSQDIVLGVLSDPLFGRG